MRKVVGIQDIIECNRILQEKGFTDRVHLRDACGKQTMWMESQSNGQSNNQTEELYQCLESYFTEKGLSIRYSEDKLNFWVD